MLNYIWLGLVLAAVIIAGVTGQMDNLTAGAFAGCQRAVIDTAFPLIGFMALWLGMMRLAEKAGLVDVLARALRPILVRLFPEVPPHHPAMGSMVMNMAANMLGLNNAATPLGLRAMQDLEKLNPRPGVATNAMCTFLAINTSSIQLIPATVVGILVAAKAANPTAIIGTTFAATVVSTIAAVLVVKFLEKLPAYQLPPLAREGSTPPALPAEASSSAGADAPGIALPTPRLVPWAAPVLILFFGFFAWVAGQMILGHQPATPSATLVAAVEALSTLAIPFLLSFFPLYAALCRVPVYEEFVEGAKDGFQVAIRIIPFLVAILVAIGMFRDVGGIKLIADILGPLLRAVAFPVELLPLVLMRPLSGGGSLGIFRDLVSDLGPDNPITRMGATIMGSSETTFYVIAVYFGSVAIRRTRHAVPAGLIADFVGVVTAIAICRLVFT